jgi:hypothetical protein
VAASALRPDAQAVGCGVYPRDAASARSDRLDVDLAHVDQLAYEFALFSVGDPRVFDRRYIESGSTHVGDDDVAKAHLRACDRRADDAGDRPRLHGHDRELLRNRGRHETTLDLSEEHFADQTTLARSLGDAVYVADHQRAQLRVHRRRRGPPVLTDAGRDLVAARHEE